jgi:hypothetical protein
MRPSEVFEDVAEHPAGPAATQTVTWTILAFLAAFSILSYVALLILDWLAWS